MVHGRVFASVNIRWSSGQRSWSGGLERAYKRVTEGGGKKKGKKMREERHGDEEGSGGEKRKIRERAWKR